MVSSQPRGLDPRNLSKHANARKQASCTTSSASCGLLMGQRARFTAAGRCGPSASSNAVAFVERIKLPPRTPPGRTYSAAECRGERFVLTVNRRATKAQGDLMHPIGTRRDFLKLLGVGGAVFASGLGSACSTVVRRNGAQDDDFFFVQLSDTHWGFSGPPNPEAENTLLQAVQA